MKYLFHYWLEQQLYFNSYILIYWWDYCRILVCTVESDLFWLNTFCLNKMFLHVYYFLSKWFSTFWVHFMLSSRRKKQIETTPGDCTSLQWRVLAALLCFTGNWSSESLHGHCKCMSFQSHTEQWHLSDGEAVLSWWECNLPGNSCMHVASGRWMDSWAWNLWKTHVDIWAKIINNMRDFETVQENYLHRILCHVFSSLKSSFRHLWQLGWDPLERGEKKSY